MIPLTGPMSLHSLGKEYKLEKPFSIQKIKDRDSTIPSGPLNLKYFYGKTIPAIKEALIYENQSVLMSEINNRRPQTPLDIFNSWGRFDGETYYDNKDSATGNSAAWVYDSATNSVVMPLNVEPTNGFVSNALYDNYVFETVVTSTSKDDDGIGIIAAFVRINSINYYITFVATKGGLAPASGVGVYYNYIRSSTNKALWTGTTSTSSKASGGNGWSSKTVKLKIKRDGDILQFWHSDGNTLTLPVLPQFTLDLNSDPDLIKFKGKQKYGYMTLSEPNATYQNISFTGGTNESTILDFSNDEIWNYNNTNKSWENSGESIRNSFGYDKIIINPEGESGTFNIFKITKTELIKIGQYTNYTDVNSRINDNIIILDKSLNTSNINGSKITKLYKEDLTNNNLIVGNIDIISKTTNSMVISKTNQNYTIGNSYIVTNTNEVFFVDTIDSDETTLTVYKIDNYFNIY